MTARRPPYSLRLAGVRGPIGFGSAISRFTGRLGLRSCVGCARRAERLDRVLVFAPRERRAGLTAQSPCWFFHGRCTGFGSRQCVIAPESQSPDAATVEQCCGGWFQYPWIEICPGQAPRMGCGFCLW